MKRLAGAPGWRFNRASLVFFTPNQDAAMQVHLHRLRTAAAAALLATAGLAAQAASYSLSLTGTVANGSAYSFDVGATRYDGWTLTLDGLSPASPLLLQQGDTVDARITLDSPLTVLASEIFTSHVLILRGLDVAEDGSATTATFDFKRGGVSVAGSGGSGCTTSGQLAACVAYFAPDNGVLTFDELAISLSVDTLSGPSLYDTAVLSHTRVSDAAAVPEPASWALLLAGAAALGLRRRRR
jgi:hypothetical protein